MSEYEIFNEDEGIKIIPEPKKRKTKTAPKKAESKIECTFLREAFSFENLSLPLSILSIFFTFLFKFISFVSFGIGGMVAAGIFFFFSFSTAFAALIVEIIPIIKNRSFDFNVKFVLILLAFFTLFI